MMYWTVQIASKSECVTYIILSAVGLIGNNKTATQPLHRERNPLLHKNTKTTTAALQEFRHNNKRNTVDYDTHTCTDPSKGPMSGWAVTRKVTPMWILLQQETVSGSGISWAICKSARCSRQITTPAPYHSVFLQAGCLSCHPTNSIKALKAKTLKAVD